MKEKRSFKYRLIRDALAARIAAGLIGELPSEEEIGREFSAGRNIVRQALALLAEDGFIVKERGRRAQVCSARFADPLKNANFVLLQRYNYQCDNDNPIYSAIVSRLLEIAACRSARLELLYLPEPGAEEYTRLVAAKLDAADGVFLTGIPREEPPGEIAGALERHPRSVGLDYVLGSFGKYFTGTDNYAGGRLAAHRLALRRRRHPLLFCGANSFYTYSPMIARALGFRDGCRAEMGSFDRAGQFVVEEHNPELYNVRGVLERAFARDGAIDSVFAVSDIAALNVVRALRSLGRRVPEDVSVVGFDGVAADGEFAFLASVRQNVEAVAERGFSLMEKLIRGEIAERCIVLEPPSFREGASL